MPAAAVMDVRAVATKLLKAHKLVLMHSETSQDPQLPNVKVVTIKFTRRQNQSPKAFFDALNENGIQYSKRSKNPNDTTIICELWRRGDKKRVTELRRKAKDRARKVDKGTSGTIGGGSSSPYIGPPSAGNGSVLVMSSKDIEQTAEELLSAGHTAEAIELLKLAGEQNWVEFSTALKRSLEDQELYKSPEAKTLRERISKVVVSSLGTDSGLYKDVTPKELSKRVRECLQDNLDLVLDVSELSDSIIRRVANTPSVENVGLLVAGYSCMARTLPREDPRHATVSRMLKDAKLDLIALKRKKKATRVHVTSPLSKLVISGDLPSAKVLLSDM